MGSHPCEVKNPYKDLRWKHHKWEYMGETFHYKPKPRCYKVIYMCSVCGGTKSVLRHWNRGIRFPAPILRTYE